MNGVAAARALTRVARRRQELGGERRGIAIGIRWRTLCSEASFCSRVFAFPVRRDERPRRAARRSRSRMTLRHVSRRSHPGYVIGDRCETGPLAGSARRNLHQERKCYSECGDARQPVHASPTIAVGRFRGNANPYHAVEAHPSARHLGSFPLGRIASLFSLRVRGSTCTRRCSACGRFKPMLEHP